MSYKEKYLKYKKKLLDLKGGASPVKLFQKIFLVRESGTEEDMGFVIKISEYYNPFELRLNDVTTYVTTLDPSKMLKHNFVLLNDNIKSLNNFKNYYNNNDNIDLISNIKTQNFKFKINLFKIMPLSDISLEINELLQLHKNDPTDPLHKSDQSFLSSIASESLIPNVDELDFEEPYPLLETPSQLRPESEVPHTGDTRGDPSGTTRTAELFTSFGKQPQLRPESEVSHSYPSLTLHTDAVQHPNTTKLFTNLVKQHGSF